jgi:hypothetical protein
VSDTFDGPRSAPKPQKVRAAKEPPKIKVGTWIQICPDDPELSTWAKVVMCLPRARVQVEFRGGAWMTVARSLVRVP